MPSDVVNYGVYVIITVLVICLVLKYYDLWMRFLSGRTNRASSPRIVTNQVVQGQNVDELRLDDRSLELLSHGLDLYEVQSLPTSQFKKNEEGEKPMNGGDCVICLGEFEEGEWLRHLPNCGHGFHVPCIDRWFQSNSDCPLCRSRVHIDLAANPEWSISDFTWLETWTREDFYHERAARLHFIANLSI